MRPCVLHLPYRPQFELHVGLPPTSTVNESHGVVTGATFPLLRREDPGPWILWLQLQPEGGFRSMG
jgi:hypothetical protein